ncbi:hypothetical protein CAPTEDRAFT_214784 [Capitella teleta]|uniref:G protein gamma domain-containing protein n=1 Tax=Capitella teleta TaxID=283909 RepID=R7UHK6_CAPTE|nr:hypothetical protein CAPTEDRAFT_214784 [Capitella teleta]|eukprot:ELU05543.1 hypothetical protein CAPTEDRAFT_214784 [Capitella teleta]
MPRTEIVLGAGSPGSSLIVQPACQRRNSKAPGGVAGRHSLAPWLTSRIIAVVVGLVTVNLDEKATQATSTGFENPAFELHPDDCPGTPQKKHFGKRPSNSSAASSLRRPPRRRVMASGSETKDLLLKQVESLRMQKSMKRIDISEAAQLMIDFIMENSPTDHFVNPDYPPDKTANPWVESKKCVIL